MRAYALPPGIRLTRARLADPRGPFLFEEVVEAVLTCLELQQRVTIDEVLKVLLENKDQLDILTRGVTKPVEQVRERLQMMQRRHRPQLLLLSDDTIVVTSDPSVLSEAIGRLESSGVLRCEQRFADAINTLITALENRIRDRDT